MSNIKFNFCPECWTKQISDKEYSFSSTYIDGYKKSKPKFIKGGTKVSLIDIDSIEPNNYVNYPKEDLPWIQIFNNGERMNEVGDDEKWDYWNGCVFVDIDSKNFDGNSHYNEYIQNFNRINYWVKSQLSEIAENNFYFMQVSHSGTSLHFCFYYDCERTRLNFEKCCIQSVIYVKQAYKILSYQDEFVSCEGVIDDCTKKPAQPLYISSYPIIFNEHIDKNYYEITKDSISGFISDDTLNNLGKMLVEIEPDDVGLSSDDVIFNNDGSAEYTGFSWTPKNGWRHQERWALVKVLASYFNTDKDGAFELYKNIIPIIRETSKHTEKELKQLFYQQYNGILKGLASKSKAYECLSKRMITFCEKAFKFKVKFQNEFTPKRIEFNNYDEKIELCSDEHLFKYVDYIVNSDKQFIHIDAGCGVGKTSGFRDYIIMKANEPQDLFNVSKKPRFCFVTPMTSINGDNFDGILNYTIDETGKYYNINDYWSVVDSKHKNYNDVQSTKSICTTWNSFHLADMVNSDFDVFIFDEAHTLYSYDYRVQNIYDVFNDLKFLANNGKKIIFMTGTPGKEMNYFQFHKIKIEKIQEKIPCNITVYNDSYKPTMYKDILDWIGSDKSHVAVIFDDTANADTGSSMETRGIFVDMTYNKLFDEDVAFINDTHTVKGQVVLCSVYGQAGININATENQIMRLYVCNNNAMSIIQYTNRIRNKDRVESINIYRKRCDITDYVKPFDNRSKAEIQKILEYYDKTNQYSSLFRKQTTYINVKLGLSSEYIELVEDINGTKHHIINDDKFNIFSTIQSTEKYESQMQIVYNRLIDAYYEPRFIYLEEDDKDTRLGKLKNNFADAILHFNPISDVKIKKGNVIIEPKNKTTKRHLIGTALDNVKYIVSKLSDMYQTSGVAYNEQDEKKFIKEKFDYFCSMMVKKHKTVRKTDIDCYADILHILKYKSVMRDEIFVKFLYDNNTIINDNHYLMLAANYVALTSNPTEDWNLIMMNAEECYRLVKKLHKMIKDFDWVSELWLNLTDRCELNNSKDDENTIKFQKRILQSLVGSHTNKRKSGQKVIAKLSNGMIYKIFNNITVCADELNVNRKTIINALKTGEVVNKLMMSFSYEK